MERRLHRPHGLPRKVRVNDTLRGCCFKFDTCITGGVFKCSFISNEYNVIVKMQHAMIVLLGYSLKLNVFVTGGVFKCSFIRNKNEYNVIVSMQQVCDCVTWL